MTLTGKAKIDFEKWYWNDWLTGSDRDSNEKDEVIEDLWKAEKMFLFPLIIEWLDSVGINIAIEITANDFNKNVCYSYAIYGEHKFEDYIGYQKRQEATKSAIIKANELYNGRDKNWRLSYE